MRAIRAIRSVWIIALLALVAPGLRAAEPAAAPVTVDVDLTDVQRRIFRVRLVLPVQPGPLSLHYPQWLPGNHAARGPIEQVTALRFTAGESTLPWRRDPLDVFRFEVEVPQAVRELAAEFVLATPHQAGTGQNSRIVASPQLLNLQWNQVVLYPAGTRAIDMPVSASVRLPAGWRAAGALRGEPVDGDASRIRFETVPLEVLVDSPLFAGPVHAEYDLTPPGGAPVQLHVFGDEAADVRASDVQVAAHRNLVRETIAALGPPRYDRYDFLLHLSSSISGIGLEHHRSSENSQPAAHFRDPESDMDGRDLLAHELVHSWNGKYRRPARLWTPHYNTPMQGDLLWVYEGLTQYYGMILSTRAGIWSPQFLRDELATIAAVFDRRRPGRAWRSLEDTTAQPVMTARRPLSWVSLQRTEDYYSESVLLWLDVDTRLRELSGGRRTLDDFARAFFAAPASQGWVSTYEFADVVRALDAVAPFDWAGFLDARVSGTGQPLLDGIERAGYRLAYTAEPNSVQRDLAKSSGATDLAYSLGVVLSRDNVLTEVVWDSPAFNAGLAVQTTLVAVNRRAASGELLRMAITRASEEGAPIELLVRSGDRFRTVSIDYRGGLQYPHLVPVEGRREQLAPLLAPRAGANPPRR